jgi:hypothetical protein
MVRAFVMILGVTILLIGIAGVAIDVAGAIADGLNRDPNVRVITPFPLGTLYGAPCLLLGYRLLFTKWAGFFSNRVKTQASGPGGPPFRTEPLPEIPLNLPLE